MQIGRLKERITIQSVVAGKGDTGAPTESTTTVATVWAEVRMIAGSEQLEQPLEQVGTSRLYRITIRYRDDVVPTMTLLWEPKEGVSHTLQVRSVIDPNGKRELLQIDCSEES